MSAAVAGRVWKLGDNVSGDDGIIHFSQVPDLGRFDIPALKAMCFATLRPEFPAQVKAGDIVVAGRNPAETTVREIMSGPIITGRAEWTLAECSRLMQEKKIRHLPIADEHGTLIGLISATDIFMAVEEQGWIEN